MRQPARFISFDDAFHVCLLLLLCVVGGAIVVPTLQMCFHHFMVDVFFSVLTLFGCLGWAGSVLAYTRSIYQTSQMS